MMNIPQRNRVAISEILVLVCLALPIVVTAAVLGTDLVNQRRAQGQLKLLQQEISAQGRPINNDGMEDRYWRSHNDAHSADMLDVASACLSDAITSGQRLGDWDIASGLHDRENVLSQIDSNDRDRSQRLAPLLETLDRILVDKRPIWQPRIWNGFQTLLPDLDNIVTVRQVLVDEYFVAVSDREHRRAIQALDLQRRLARSIKPDDFVVSILVYVACENVRIQAIEDGLSLGFWDTPEVLAEVETQIGQMPDLDQLWRSACDCESLLVQSELERVRTSFPRMLAENEQLPMAIASSRQELELVSTYHRIANTRGAGTPAHCRQMRRIMHEATKNNRADAYSAIPVQNNNLLVNAYLWSAVSMSEAMLRYHRAMQICRVAVAIKRFQLSHQRWPQGFQELEPSLAAGAKGEVSHVSYMNFRPSADDASITLWASVSDKANVPDDPPDFSDPNVHHQYHQVQIR